MMTVLNYNPKNKINTHKSMVTNKKLNKYINEKRQIFCIKELQLNNTEGIWKTEAHHQDTKVMIAVGKIH